jgi:DNA-binding transcriptional regulator LsrR (DeoR family)
VHFHAIVNLYGNVEDMSRQDELRLMVKVARMYYVQRLRQQSITERLRIHQSSVSRLLKRARDANIVRFSVAMPPGIYSDLEDQLTATYSLKNAVVIDGSSEEEPLVRDLGAAAAFYLETTLKPGINIGISSWSRSLFAMVDALQPGAYCKGGKVVQILGGVGNAEAQQEAAIYLAQRLAAAVGASAILLQSPAVVAAAEARRVLFREPLIREAVESFRHLDIALVGIGSMEPSRLLASSGNVFSAEERSELRRLGAVGDICFRYFDARGVPIKSSLMRRVIGIESRTLRAVELVIGIAGGKKKLNAIQAALRGGWIDVLITDHRTAEGLMSNVPKVNKSSFNVELLAVSDC